jgi:hypothetical protein
MRLRRRDRQGAEGMDNGNSWNTSRTLPSSVGKTSFIMAANRDWRQESHDWMLPHTSETISQP